MNSINFKRIFICACFFIQLSCNKKDIEYTNQSKNINITNSIMDKIPKIKSIMEIEINDPLVGKFLQKNNTLINHKEIQSANFYKILFLDKKELSGLQIHYINNKNYEKDIFFVINNKSNMSEELIREKYIENENVKNFIIKFKEINGNVIINDIIENGKVRQNISKENNDYLIKSNMIPIWHCSFTMFNMIYQEAKKRCEENVICDFGCSFSNCSIAYLAYAIDKCTVNA